MGKLIKKKYVTGQKSIIFVCIWIIGLYELGNFFYEFHGGFLEFIVKL